MKVIVPVKRVPDPYGRVRLNASGALDLADIKWVVNPFDEIALEEAVRMRERGAAVEIVAVSVGTAECEPILRTALAMGADRAVLIESAEGVGDSSTVARMLHAVIARELPDLVLMGKQAIDDDNGQVGGRVAARWGAPQATFASAIEVSTDGKSATITREVDSGRETLRVTLPAVITTDLRLNEPRYVALPAILRARSKPLDRIAAATLGEMPAARLSVVRMEAPESRRRGRRVGSVAELVSALRDEAKVI
ncbi:MAG TPA: electron transfer flavoprotein subunit beta/FixA family protein [Chthonomonadaceae bacterium]|nr:electron transfer flavoprotein subunit beta/FixA family protein [Chthonomonadaceae bacterium]